MPPPPSGESSDADSPPKTVSLLYFVSLVTRLGRDSESCEIPGSVNTVGELLDWLRQRGKPWDSLLQDNKVNVTVNKQFAKPTTPIASNDEIAIMPVDPLQS
ncbi:MAG: MoaD/ThiS family protein [Gammaproteobacteria bacterium]|nr:MoaD/ThiS family protein [Gammaproteobacteria bacterium]